MYPNPQDALPLPAQPSVEQYKKLAKDLVRACRSGDPAAIDTWASRWIRTAAANEVSRFARTKLASADGTSSKCVLTSAQFVIARAHGFLSWPAFAKHLESLALASSPVSAFEAAASAIVAGDERTLARLLRERPNIVHARSTREHRATLLHYVTANGVENYRQVSPRNIAAITEMLLAAGADVEAEADVYGSGCTALGLVATSAPPAIAGVQLDVIDVLLRHGARMDRAGIAGRTHSLVRACLANGQPEAAEYLARRGAPLDLPGAAGIGRLDVVKRLAEDGELTGAATTSQTMDAFSLACAYGRAHVVQFFLERGLNPDAQLSDHGEGHTGLHVAAFHGHVDAVTALLARGARVDAIDKTWGTTPLVWALTGWSRVRAPEDRAPYYEVVSRLVAAGSSVTLDLRDGDEVRADAKMIAALTGG